MKAYKVNVSTKKNLRQEYEKACNAYLLELANMWGWNCAAYGFWVGDAVGEMYCYGDNTCLNMKDIIFCVENDVAEEKFIEYTDYCIKCSEYNFNIPNFESYFYGCKINQETFNKLDKLKQNLQDCIDETKEKISF